MVSYSLPLARQYAREEDHTTGGGKAIRIAITTVMDPFDPDAIIHVLSRCEACQLGQVGGSSVFVPSQDQRG